MISISPFNVSLVQAQENIIERKILTGFTIELGYTLSCEDGRKLALTEAKNKALSDIGTYLFRTSIVDFGTLTKDKVMELTGGYMSTKELRFECDGKKATVEIESLIKIDVEELKKSIAEIIERDVPEKVTQIDNKSPFPKGNLIVNGDFEKPWNVGWQRLIGDLKEGVNRIKTVKGPNSNNFLHLYHEGKSYMMLFQEIPIEHTNLLFSVSFKPHTWEGPMHGFGGTGMALIGLQYQDEKGDMIGETQIFNYVKNPFADSALGGVPRPKISAIKKSVTSQCLGYQ